MNLRVEDVKYLLQRNADADAISSSPEEIQAFLDKNNLSEDIARSLNYSAELLRSEWQQWLATAHVEPPSEGVDDLSGNPATKVKPEIALEITEHSPESETFAAENQTHTNPSDDMQIFGQGNKPKKPFVKPAAPAIRITLPNGMVGVAYQYAFDEKKLGEYGITSIIAIKGLEELGLQFDLGPPTLKGKPLTEGMFEMDVNFYMSSGGAASEEWGKLSFLVNPDPQSLWKNIEPPAGEAHQTPNAARGFQDGAPLGRVIAASRRGRSHAHSGTFRDDSFGIEYLAESQWHILAVADGAGSAKLSRRGAAIACEASLEYLRNNLPNVSGLSEKLTAFKETGTPELHQDLLRFCRQTLANAAHTAQAKIAEEAKNEGCPIRDYSTTLLLCACKKFEAGYFTAAFWVGDGGMGIFCKNAASPLILGVPDSGEYAGQTRFLTMSDIFQNEENISRRLKVDLRDDFTALILMSDGVTDPRFETDAGLQNQAKWEALWAELQEKIMDWESPEAAASQLESWLNFWSPGNHDDRTMVILY